MSGTGHLGTGHLGTGHLGTGHLGTGHLGTGHLGTGDLGTDAMGIGGHGRSDVESWTDWPSREALSREGLAVGRRVLSWVGRVGGLAGGLWATFANEHLTTPQVLTVLAVTAVGVFAFWGFVRSVPRMDLRRSLLWLTFTYVQAILCGINHAPVMGIIFMCGIALGSIQRLPIVAAAPFILLATSVFIVVVPTDVQNWGNVTTILGLGILGYVTRQDWEARAQTQRTLSQERALRTVEAEAAALAERARIAREIHDVLAHSLSAQLVHLEAARLMVEGEADREQIRERIVAARRMAQDGLLETRAALSALRGEFRPIGEFLVKLTEDASAKLEVVGTPRPLTAEVGVAVRRTAQEALTNVRKHAPGALCTVRLSYLEGSVELEVVDQGGSGSGRLGDSGLASSGSGLGLLGMRERAELLGGSLEAGPTQGGFRVLLRIEG
ncbi:signal transduction histidine kinase [Streptacidiphilus sp. MAP12-33]|uniref:sensor histidine kinase n=1 Tax=Streptacidiphilus sp. MAP12-33 TaxID=3156266 RepID=UPI003515FF92